MDHDRTEAVLTDIKLSCDHDFDLPMAVSDALEKAADLIRDLCVEIGRLETAKVSIDVSTGDDDANNRVFGLAVERQADDAGLIRLLCEYESDNFGMREKTTRTIFVSGLIEALNEIASLRVCIQNSPIKLALAIAIADAALASIGRKPE